MSTLTNQGSQLVLLRHAPITGTGRLCGRSDVPAHLDTAVIADVTKTLGTIETVVTSPALRCRQTAKAIWPGLRDIPQDARLWEQDFGEHDGLPYNEIPDLGPMTNVELAKYAAPGGESFDDVCSRVAQPLHDYAKQAFVLQKPIVLVVHAGVTRAAIGLAMNANAAALSFEVNPLSATRFRVGEHGLFSIISTNVGPL